MSMTRVFRLFVSSTFSDFIVEREALQKVVFPELEAYCAKRGARFQAVDLRWGITEEAQREHDTMRICLEEVRRCQQLSPRPNFAVLLGDRYGWEPVPARIPLEHWARLQAAALREDWLLIEASYRLDENAIPPVYCLHAGLGDGRLLQALRKAARDFQGEARLPYFASATHQEIVLGALSPQDVGGQPLHPEQHVHVYVRHLAGLPQDPSAKDFMDWDPEQGQPADGARDRMRELEAALRRQLGQQVHDLRTTWSDHGHSGNVDQDYLERFCRLFLEHQTRLIDAELASLSQIDEWQRREHAHQQFGAERARVFAGREALLERIARYTAPRSEQPDDEAPQGGVSSPLILLGAGGSGKSALLARAACDAAQQAQAWGAVLAQRYIGGVPGSESLMAMLGELTADIALYYGQPAPPLPNDSTALAEAFLAALGYASAERPLIVFLDALDQLDPSDGAWALGWLPKELPEHVRIVVSVRAGTVVAEAAGAHYSQGLVDVQPMTPGEGAAMLDVWLGDRRAAWFNAGIAPSTGRRLTSEQRAAVLEVFSESGSPLWLKLAYEEAATWASWDAPRQLPSTVQGLIEDLVDNRLIKQENHPRVFTEQALAYLTAGRAGLSESELGRALGTDPAVRIEFKANEKTQRGWEDARQLPPILWSRLYFDLQAYLGLAQVDGAFVMRWFHREFVEVLRERYLGTKEDRRAVHGALADTFLALERETRGNPPDDGLLFKSTDAAGQQVSAAMRRVMEQPWQLARAGRLDDLQTLMTDFGFCMGQCAANRIADLAENFGVAGGSSDHDSPLTAWMNLLAEKVHLLRRGNCLLPAHKILLQIASEHADDSAVTRAAQAWLSQGHCDWVWLRNRKRPERQVRSAVLAVLEGHTDWVTGAQSLPDGRLLSWSQDNTLRLWEGESGAILAVLEGHTGWVKGARVLPDGRLLSWSLDGTLRLWDGESGAMLAVLEGHTSGVLGAQVLPDGRWLSWSDDHTLRLWGGESGATHMVLEGHTDVVNGAQALPDGRLLSWSDDRTLRLWDGESGVMLAVLEGHTFWVEGAQVLPDGRLLSWCGDRQFRDPDDHTLRLWDGESGAMLAVLEGHTGPVLGAQVLPDGRLLSWSYDGTLRLWDSANGAMLAALEGHTTVVNAAQVLPDGRLLSLSWDNTLRLWDGDSGAMLAVLEGHTDTVNGARFLPDGRLLSWSQDNTLRLWDGESGAMLAVLEGHSFWVEGAQLLPDGRLLSWSLDGTLRLWNGASGPTFAALEGHTQEVDGARVLPDGRLLSWSRDHTLRLWDGESAAMLAVLEGHTRRVTGAQSLPDGRLLSWSNDHTLRLWDGESGAMLAVLEGHTFWVKGAQVLPDGRPLSWSLDGTLRLWDGESGAMLAVLEGHTSAVLGAQVLPDGRLLSWSQDNTLRLWDGESGAMLAVLEGHTLWVEGAQLLPDGRLLSWSLDGTLRLWDGESGAMRDVSPQYDWVPHAPFPCPWESLTSVAKATRTGDVWSKSLFDSVYVANRKAAWIAHWQGDSLKSFGVTAHALIAGSGRHLLFLELMRGAQPLNERPTHVPE